MKERIFISVFCDNICVHKNVAIDIDHSITTIDNEAKILIKDISSQDNMPVGNYTYTQHYKTL